MRGVRLACTGCLTECRVVVGRIEKTNLKTGDPNRLRAKFPTNFSKRVACDCLELVEIQTRRRRKDWSIPRTGAESLAQESTNLRGRCIGKGVRKGTHE